MRVLEVTPDETVTDNFRVLKRVGTFGHEGRDVIRLGDIDGNDPGFRRGEISPEPENIAIAAKKTIMRILLVQQLHHWRVRFLEVLVEDPVLRVGPLRDVDDEESSVLAHVAVEAPILMVLTFVNQLVLVLGGPELVEIELMKIVRLLELLSRSRRIVTAVEKPRAILLP